MAWPRIIASGLLLVFGISHLLAINGGQNVFFEQHNAVIPFMKNGSVLAFAGLIQILIAIVCYRRRYNPQADVMIIGVVILLVWYQVMRWLLGDRGRCGCTGLLHHFINLNADQEQRYAMGGMLMLTACAAVGFLRSLRNNKSCKQPRQQIFSHLVIYIVLVLSSGLCQTAQAASGIRLQGTLTEDRLNGYGKPHADGRRLVWHVELSQSGTWSIYSSNILENGWQMFGVYDKTNVYLIQPSVSDASSPRKLMPDFALDLAEVIPGPLPLLSSDDVGNLTDLWICFCSLHTVRAINQAEYSIAWPILGWHPRINLRAWGFRWKFSENDFSASTGDRFASQIGMIRDNSLDAASFDKALLRPEIIYPMNPESRREHEQQWIVLQSYTNGALGTMYQVLEWQQTKDGRIPRKAKLSSFGPGNPLHPYKEAVINVDQIDHLELDRHSPPEFARETRVDDYRYQEKDSRKQFPAATYIAVAGEGWRGAEDARLLRQQEAWRKRGPRFPIAFFSLLHVAVLISLVPVIGMIVWLWRWIGRQRFEPKQNPPNLD